MSARINDESRPSFPSSSPLSSLRSPSPVPVSVSEHSKQCPEKRRGRRQKQNNATSYELRPRSARQDEPDENQSLETPASGHFTKAESDVLKDTFTEGVWTPGNITVRSLKKELKHRDGRQRSDKQIRDWFSHQRRKHRESGKNISGENLSDVVEGLLLLKGQPMQAKPNN